MKKEYLDELQAKLSQRQNELRQYFFASYSNIKGMDEREPKDEIDHASASIESFLDDTLIKHHKNEYDEIEVALQKIRDNVYGVCEMCADEIDIERLRVKPHAKFCIVCREYVEKNNTGRKR